VSLANVNNEQDYLRWNYIVYHEISGRYCYVLSAHNLKQSNHIIDPRVLKVAVFGY
jgi:hypothetical protein